MTKKLKKLLIRIIIAAILFAALFTAEKTGLLGFLDGKWYAFVPWLVPYQIAGYDVLLKAAKNIAHGQIFDENFLMMIATFAAFGIGEYTEGVAVMVFYQIGEWFQQYAVGKSRKSISAMMEIVPEYANLVHDGEVTEEDPEDVHVDDIILIKPGERVPLDGVVLEGSSFLDQSSLTGESVPVRISEGQEILSGCINQSEVLKVRVTKEYVDSTVSRILELVENASSRKAKVENFITRFARIYTPVVTIAAVLLAVIPPLFFGQAWAEWIRRACTFLVISCPCALVISVPLGFFAGIGAASKLGVLVKGSNYLEILSNVRTMVFDKTGTLTRGEFSVAEVLPAEGVSRETLLRTAAQLEAYSNHPIAAALRAACKDAPEAGAVTKAEEIAGQGILAVYEGKVHVIGNLKLMDAEGIPAAALAKTGTLVYVGRKEAGGSGTYLGAVLIKDALKDGTQEALKSLQKSGIRRTVMLTGDRQEAAQEIASALGIDQVFSGLLPGDKVQCMEELLQESSEKERIAFAGDGLNDAPVLMRADLGIAMGSLGSDAAIEAADIVLMDDDIRKIARTVAIARKTLRIVRQNIWFALGVKLIVLILGALGIAGMWLAVFADVGVAVIAILNSMRAMKLPKE